MATEAPDEDLARNAADPRAGAAAFQALYDRHAGRLTAFVRSRWPGRADDICQEAWLRAHRELRAAAAMTNFRGWLFTVAANLGRDGDRRRRPDPLGAVAEPADAAARPPDHNLIDDERRAVVAGCLERLAADLRAAVEAAAAGEPPADVAARLGVTRTVMDQRKSRGLAALRKCVEAKLP